MSKETPKPAPEKKQIPITNIIDKNGKGYRFPNAIFNAWENQQDIIRVSNSEGVIAVFNASEITGAYLILQDVEPQE